MSRMNERLEGRVFTDCYGQKATVWKSIAGLAPGYVCVRGADGRSYVENLRYVLSMLEDPESDLVLAASLLAQADALKERAMAVAGAAATKKMSSRAVHSALALHASMSSALEASPSEQDLEASSDDIAEPADAEAEQQPAGLRI